MYFPSFWHNFGLKTCSGASLGDPGRLKGRPVGVRGGLGEAPGALREAILDEKVVFGKCAGRRGARGVPEGSGAPCGCSVLLRRRSGRATTPSERASWQGRNAKKSRNFPKCVNFSNSAVKNTNLHENLYFLAPPHLQNS